MESGGFWGLAYLCSGVRIQTVLWRSRPRLGSDLSRGFSLVALQSI